RSKMAAAILKNLKLLPVKKGHKVLYLGAASGTTASHVSDIVEESGHVYCVEFASRAMRELINNLCPYRPNITPILEDARFPEKYAIFIPEKVEMVYCDIAQPEQAKILADNADHFLKKEGWIMLAVKAQSIDVTKEPSEIYRREVKVLEERGFKVEDLVHLEPYDKAHAMILARKYLEG
ncbi:MAG: fibrillarin-like rRNA/tRNA 2'-O-methyltransferase, partial [Candidatus Bathyarchaeia archaeon]